MSNLIASLLPVNSIPKVINQNIIILGILEDSKTKASFQVEDLGSEDQHDLLIRAIIDNNHELVEKLLQYDFDVDFEYRSKGQNENNFNAVDKAWQIFSSTNNQTVKEACNKIMLSLIYANSKFPRGFEYGKASMELQALVNYLRI